MVAVSLKHWEGEEGGGGMVWYGMPCGLGAAHRLPLTFPGKGPGSGQ